MQPRIIDRLEPSQDREVRPARVMERAAGLGPAGEEFLAEPREVGDPVPPGLLGEGLRVERLRDRHAAGAGAHQGQHIDPVPRQQLGGGLLGEAGELPVRGRGDNRQQEPLEPDRGRGVPVVDTGGACGRPAAGVDERTTPGPDEAGKCSACEGRCASIRSADRRRRGEARGRRSRFTFRILHAH